MATAKRVHTWRKRNPVEFLEYRKKRMRIIRQIIMDAKSVPCADCTTRHPFYVMTFDHVRGTKRYELGRIARRWSISLKTLAEEIAKCDVVCHNCHATRTYSRRKDYYGGINGDEDTTDEQ